MKKQVTILFTAAFLLVAFQVSSFAQKANTTEKSKIEQEEMLKKALEEKARAEEFYKTRISNFEGIDESVSREFFNQGTGYAFAYPDGYVNITGRSQNSETLEFRKSVRESSFTKEVPFDIEEGTRKASIGVSGSCKEGEIRIKILMPGGKTYTEILLDEFGSVNWNKSFTIDEDNNSRTGEWKFVISATDATGNLSISIRSS